MNDGGKLPVAQPSLAFGQALSTHLQLVSGHSGIFDIV
jgi:hypothetical protein